MRIANRVMSLVHRLEVRSTSMNSARSLLLGTVSLSVSLLGADLAGVGQACAATITEPLVSTGSHSTEYPTNGYGDLSVPLFNSALGTLTSVQIILTGILNGTGTATNLTDSPQTLGYDKESFVSLLGTGMPALRSAIDALNGGNGLIVTTNLKRFTVAGSNTITVGPVSGSNSKSLTFSSSLSQFEQSGGGYAPLTVSTYTQDQLTETGGYFKAAVVTTADVSLAVTYTYTPNESSQVPEPGSLMLLGTGLAGVGIASRRKRLRWPRWLRRRCGAADSP